LSGIRESERRGGWSWSTIDKDEGGMKRKEKIRQFGCLEPASSGKDKQRELMLFSVGKHITSRKTVCASNLIKAARTQIHERTDPNATLIGKSWHGNLSVDESPEKGSTRPWSGEGKPNSRTKRGCQSSIGRFIDPRFK
jgi:hypothetical protein